MKKIALYGSITLAVVAVGVLVLWQSIAATLGWYVLLFTTDNPAIALTPVEQPVLGGVPVAEESVAFDQITIPVLSESTPELRNSSSTVVVTLDNRNAAYYIATMTPFAAAFAANPAFSAEYKDIICTDLSWTADPCASNQAFVAALLAADPANVSLLSNRSHKISHAVFTSLKTIYIAPDTTNIYTISTDHYTGYLTYSPTLSLAFLFDDAGNEYELSFLSMSEEEVTTVLHQFTPVPTQ